MSAYDGLHPAIGALDVCPVVWLDAGRSRAAARPTAVAVAERIGGARRAGLPLRRAGAPRPSARERAYFRNGGLAELWLRMEGGELRPDHGPDAAAPHRRRDPGHRPPAARRLQRRARQRRRRGRARGRRRAARVRRRPAGRAGDRPRALGSGRGQVSTNVHDPLGGAARRASSSGSARSPRRSAPARSRPSWSGWSREAALAGYPGDVPIRGFDPARQTIERRLRGARRLRRPRPTRFEPWPRRRRSAAASTAGPRAAASTPSAAPARAAARRRRRGPARAAAGAQRGDAPPTWRSSIDPRRRRRGDLRRPAPARSSSARSAPRSPSAPSCSPSTSRPATTSTR